MRAPRSEADVNRFQKLMKLLGRPAYWPALARGVAAGVEHEAAFVCREYASVIDVGANKGQFATFARARWPAAKIVCFEPLPSPRAKLESVTTGSVEIHAIALGEVEGEAEMHVASREDSSSLQPLGDAQKQLFDMDEIGQLTVPVRRLDAVIDAAALPRPTLLKIDVQGFEYETLKGAAGLLGVIDAVYVEASFVELYTGQKLAINVAELLTDGGFTQTGQFNVYREGGRDVQADLLFLRSELMRSMDMGD